MASKSIVSGLAEPTNLLTEGLKKGVFLFLDAASFSNISSISLFKEIFLLDASALSV